MMSFKALERQFALHQRWHSDQVLPEAAALAEATIGVGVETSAVYLLNIMRMVLASAETFFVTEEIAALLLESFDTLPDTPLDDIPRPARTGFVLTDRPIKEFVSPAGSKMKVTAFSWHPSYDSTSEVEGLFFAFFASMDDREELRVISTLLWPYLDGWKEPWEDLYSNKSEVEFPEGPALLRTLRGFVLAFFAFCQQTIATTISERPPRSTRKRMERAGAVDPVVHIVTLRRKEHKPAKEGPGESVDWSCRWIVSPHWRNQYHPSDGSRRPKLIPSYVKGPEGKPLKRKGINLFSVSR